MAEWTKADDRELLTLFERKATVLGEAFHCPSDEVPIAAVLFLSWPQPELAQATLDYALALADRLRADQQEAP